MVKHAAVLLLVLMLALVLASPATAGPTKLSPSQTLIFTGVAPYTPGYVTTVPLQVGDQVVATLTCTNRGTASTDHLNYFRMTPPSLSGHAFDLVNASCSGETRSFTAAENGNWWLGLGIFDNIINPACFPNSPVVNACIVDYRVEIQINPLPDADNDGVPNLTDQCPTVAGPASNNGCPLPPSLPQAQPVPQPVPGPDMVVIPATAAVGTFVAETPCYGSPDPGAATSIIIPAGKTAWVFGVDDGGDFYLVMLAGKFFWVPVATMGPNYDALWGGRPLPFEVVKAP